MVAELSQQVKCKPLASAHIRETVTSDILPTYSLSTRQGMRTKLYDPFVRPDPGRRIFLVLIMTVLVLIVFLFFMLLE